MIQILRSKIGQGVQSKGLQVSSKTFKLNIVQRTIHTAVRLEEGGLEHPAKIATSYCAGTGQAKVSWSSINLNEKAAFAIDYDHQHRLR